MNYAGASDSAQCIYIGVHYESTYNDILPLLFFNPHNSFLALKYPNEFKSQKKFRLIPLSSDPHSANLVERCRHENAEAE